MQLFKIVNQIISKYGKPEYVVVELARELKMNKEQNEKFQKKQKENQNSMNA